MFQGQFFDSPPGGEGAPSKFSVVSVRTGFGTYLLSGLDISFFFFFPQKREQLTRTCILAFYVGIKVHAITDSGTHLPA